MEKNSKAIETRYNGYRFRSRTEARWAVFLDTLGLRYDYEKEGFELGVLGYYLCDFYLPDMNCWLEIKASQPTDDAKKKAKALAMKLQATVVILWQFPVVWCHNTAFAHFGLGIDKEGREYEASFGSEGKCFQCRLTNNKTGSINIMINQFGHQPDVADYIDERVVAASRAAMSARFEHGETPMGVSPTTEARIEVLEGQMLQILELMKCGLTNPEPQV